ncbi:unnamed protein product [Auanema sp. JU1783]|nr:unnamed protein product [Auanema sp. JU1783]
MNRIFNNSQKLLKQRSRDQLVLICQYYNMIIVVVSILLLLYIIYELYKDRIKYKAAKKSESDSSLITSLG